MYAMAILSVSFPSKLPFAFVSQSICEHFSRNFYL